MLLQEYEHILPRTRIGAGILSAIGNTPLVELTRIFAESPFRLFAKLEGYNPGGSMKDRAAFNMLRTALDKGEIQPNTTVIESSSGNMGIGLAQACAYFGLPFICVIDPKATKQNVAILRAYGAKIDLVPKPDPITGEFLQARLNRIRQLQREIPNSWWPNQYSNINNSSAHHITMHEIVTALNYELDYLICTTGTFGTLRGCAEYVRDHHLDIEIIGVDAVGSVIFNSPVQCNRLVPGHGSAVRSELFQEGLANRCVHVSDLDCIIGCRRLLKEEVIFAGGSSGAAIAAIDKIKEDIPAGSRCVVILSDRGERYLDTIYDDGWVANHFGEVSYLWESHQTITRPV